MTKVALYARHSHEPQGPREALAPFRRLRDMASQRGWREVGGWADHARSDAALDRPGFKALMAACEAGAVETVLVESLDRVSRSSEEVATFVANLQSRGISLVTLDKGQITCLGSSMRG
ncbi:recombinase family protein [Sphingomonas sp. 22176]|uniref:recombinase family protein n=1 Tax=Sphingomonas sp. 22176 TaxID=3453884 RepID=UPI003F827840